MPIFHCNDCHHEWESMSNISCDWCGASGYILDNKTALENFVNYLYKGDNFNKFLIRKEKGGEDNDRH